MDYTKKLEELNELKNEKEILDKQISDIKEDIQSAMEESGIDRVSSDSLMAIKSKRTYKRIKNDFQAMAWLESKDVPEKSYMNVDKKKVLKIAEQAIEKGEKIDWVDEKETEYISIRSK